MATPAKKKRKQVLLTRFPTRKEKNLPEIERFELAVLEYDKLCQKIEDNDKSPVEYKLTSMMEFVKNWKINYHNFRNRLKGKTSSSKLGRNPSLTDADLLCIQQQIHKGHMNDDCVNEYDLKNIAGYIYMQSNVRL